MWKVLQEIKGRSY